MYPRGLASSTAPGLYKESKRAIEIQKRSFYHHSPKIPKIKFICAGRSLDYTKFDIILADNYIIASLGLLERSQRTAAATSLHQRCGL
jgi:hypothetical protein